MKDRLPLDFAFDYDISGGLSEIIVLDTGLGPNSYRGWGINKLNINRDREAELSDVFDLDPGDNYHWNAWIDICDLDGDGKPELVSNKIALTAQQLMVILAVAPKRMVDLAGSALI